MGCGISKSSKIPTSKRSRTRSNKHRPLSREETYFSDVGGNEPCPSETTTNCIITQTIGFEDVVVLYEYKPPGDEEGSFKAGEELDILDEGTKEWVLVRSKTGHTGHIPSTYLGPRWYFGRIDRSTAEAWLLLEPNCTGSFLVRDSESHRYQFCLSGNTCINSFRHLSSTAALLSFPVRNDGDVVEHYLVRRLRTGDYTISKSQRVVFPTLRALIVYYSLQPDGLCSRLTQPCIRPLNNVQTEDGAEQDCYQIPECLMSFQTYEIPAVPWASLTTEGDEGPCWQLDAEEIELDCKLGEGSFGEVWKATWHTYGTPVAVKKLKPNSQGSQDFSTEARALERLQHPRLIRLYGMCTLSDGHVGLVMELMPNGDLLNYLRGQKGTLSLVKKLDMAVQVADAMSYLESQNWIHRDLSARNILVGYNNVVKIADFGLARLIVTRYQNQPATQYICQSATIPFKWTAPEGLGRTKAFSTKSDVWSFGVLLWEIITDGEEPYEGMTNADVQKSVPEGYQMPRPIQCPDSLYSIMIRAWNLEPSCRPTFSVLHHKLDQLLVTERNNGYLSPTSHGN